MIYDIKINTNNRHIEFETETVFEDYGNTGIAKTQREIANKLLR